MGVLVVGMEYRHHGFPHPTDRPSPLDPDDEGVARLSPLSLRDAVENLGIVVVRCMYHEGQASPLHDFERPGPHPATRPRGR